MAQGREEGRQEGFQEGLEKGLEKGRQEGEVAALLEVLDARGIEVDAASRQQVLDCSDLAQLKVWLRRALTAQSAHELFESAPAPMARKAGKLSRRSTKAPNPRSKR